jgi:hypothetical protein
LASTAKKWGGTCTAGHFDQRTDQTKNCLRSQTTAQQCVKWENNILFALKLRTQTASIVRWERVTHQRPASQLLSSEG